MTISHSHIVKINDSGDLSTSDRFHKIGDSVAFVTPKGEALTGEVEGRDWQDFEVIFYTVRVENGARYHVNAVSFKSGHWF